MSLLGGPPASALDATDGASVTALVEQLAPQMPGVSPETLTLGLRAYERAVARGAVKRPVLSLIDYSKPSTERRLWVVDIARMKVLFNERVAHGRGSGELLAKAFSNGPRSHQSSLGAFVTAETYQGKHGHSLKLDGLEPGVNDAARARAVVIHAADYVTEAFVRLHGRAGRSWGCPALDPGVALKIIDAIKGGTFVWAYAPDQQWLRDSTFLKV